MKRIAPLAVLVGFLTVGSAAASLGGTAQGSLPLGPQCSGGSCSLSLTTGPGDLTIVECSGALYAACAAIPANAVVTVRVAGRPVLCPAADTDTQALDAVEAPKWRTHAIPAAKTVAAPIPWTAKGTVAYASQYGDVTRVAAHEEWFSFNQGFHPDTCLYILNTYGQSIGDPFVEIPLSAVETAAGHRPSVNPVLYSNCTLLVPEGACLSMSGQLLPSPNLLGGRWVADTISFATCP